MHTTGTRYYSSVRTSLVFVCVCVCVRERERERENVCLRESVCMYVCVYRYYSSSTCAAHAPTTKGTPSSLIPPLPLSRLTRMERKEMGGEREEGEAGAKGGRGGGGGEGGWGIVGQQREDGGGLL
jgi:hypothetical protein